MLAFAAYKEDDYRSEKDSRKTKGIDRSADSGMWTEETSPVTSSAQETTDHMLHKRNHHLHHLSLSHAHTDAHTHTHSINTQVLFCLLSNRSINILTTNTHTRRYIFTKSFIILLLAALSISCALSAPTSTALPVG